MPVQLFCGLKVTLPHFLAQKSLSDINASYLHSVLLEWQHGLLLLRRANKKQEDDDKVVRKELQKTEVWFFFPASRNKQE